MEEIEMMQAWLADWYGVSHEPDMTPGMQRQMDKLAELSGAAFEIEFMTMMIRYHWQAIVKAAQAVDKAYHEELRQLAENIIANGPGAVLTHDAGPGSNYDMSRKH